MASGRFVGRSSQLGRMVQVGSGLTGKGLVLSGAPGAGKTRLMQEAVARVPAARFVVQVAGIIAALDSPLSGLAQALQCPAPSGLAPDGAVHWALDVLRRRAAGRPVVLAVDDAHLLDHASAAVVYLAVQQGTTLLATVRTGMPIPGPLRALRSENLTEHSELPGLDLADAALMLAGMLDGAVDPTAAQGLWQAALGNVLTLRELVHGAVEGGAMLRTFGRWEWTGSLRITPNLADVMADRFGELSPQVREVAELVAFGEPLGRDLLLRAATPAVVESAEERGLIKIVTNDRRTDVMVGDPLYAELLRRRCPLTRAMRLKACLADLVDSTGGRRHDDLLRTAAWRLDSGAAAAPDRLLAAARRALLELDLPLGGRLARAALAANPLEASELLATILMLGNRSDEALALLTSVRGDVVTEMEYVRWFTTFATVAYWGLGQFDVPARMAAAASAVKDPAARSWMQGMESVMRLYNLDCHEAHRLACAVQDENSAPGPARALAMITKAHLEALRGRFADSARTTTVVEAEAARWRTEMPVLRLVVELLKGLQLVLAGDVPGHDDLATEDGGLHNFGDGRSRTSAVALLLQANAATLRGQTGESLLVAERACVALQQSVSYSGYAHAARASALAMRGDATGAAEAFTLAEASLALLPAVLRPTVRRAGAWVTAAAGDLPGAVDQLRKLAAQLHEERLAGQELWVLHDLTRMGRPDLAARGLTQLLANVEGPLPRLFLRYAEAAGGGSATDLIDVARELWHYELGLFGLEAAAIAVRRLRGQRNETTRDASLLLAALMQCCENVWTPPLLTLQSLLTERERQVAERAAGGATSRDIAGDLFLSRRTVENHLQRVYHKLGITSRSELATVLAALKGRSASNMDPARV